MADLEALDTPALLLDADVLDRNLLRMAQRAQALGVGLRPHLKTAKSIAVARRLVAAGPLSGITVSTAKEAEYFAGDEELMAATGGDILYAVTVPAGRFQRLASLARRRGVQVTVGVDSIEVARALRRFVSAEDPHRLRALIEVDSGEHRSGVQPEDAPTLEALAEILAECGALRGVFTHAGHSYGVRGREALAHVAELERNAVVEVAQSLRDAGHTVDVVSAGSTPTMSFARRADGLTEYRAGVYVFGDMFMAGLGVCEVEDIAASVLTTVIGHQRATGRLIVDAGGLALSKDRSTGALDGAGDVGYGAIADVDGRQHVDLTVVDAYQEHGVVASTSGDRVSFERYPIGSRLRVLPNHACMTCSAYDRYAVIGDPAALAFWSRINEWR